MITLPMRWFAVAAMACAAASSAWAAPESVELKLQVKPELFAAGRTQGYNALWAVIADTAAKQGLKAKFNTEAPHDEEHELVYYYDTADGQFDAKNFTVRQKFKIKDGQVKDRGTLMLKLRKPVELTSGEIEAFKAGLSDRMVVKYEADTVGLADGVPGKLRTVYSISAKQKKMDNGNGRTVGWYMDYFPVLKATGIDAAAVLKPATATVHAVETELGKVSKGEDKAKFDVVTWYDEAGKNLKLVELSWKYKTAKSDGEMHKALHNALQQRGDTFIAGKTKTGK